MRRRRHVLLLTAAMVSALAVSTLAMPALAVPAAAAGRGKVEVVAGFYPLAWAAEQVGGKRVVVRNLTPAGTEPHDLELTTDQRDDIEDADVVLVLGDGFQAAVEDAAEARDSGTVELLRRLPIDDRSDELDPHVWLDPGLMQSIVDETAAALTKADPAGAATYARRAATVSADLDALATRFTDGLADCDRDLVVTAHEAFGYLAAAYGFRQLGVSGLAPDVEPDPRRLGELADLVERKGVTTIFTEELRVAPDRPDPGPGGRRAAHGHAQPARGAHGQGDRPGRRLRVGHGHQPRPDPGRARLSLRASQRAGRGAGGLPGSAATLRSPVSEGPAVRRRLLVLLAALACAAGIVPVVGASAASAAPAQLSDVTVSGNAGEKPTITSDWPFSVKSSVSEVRTPGIRDQGGGRGRPGDGRLRDPQRPHRQGDPVVVRRRRTDAAAGRGHHAGDPQGAARHDGGEPGAGGRGSRGRAHEAAASRPG